MALRDRVDGQSGLCTCIGAGTNAVYDAETVESGQYGFTNAQSDFGNLLDAWRIGDASDSYVWNVETSTGVRLKKTTAPVAIDGDLGDGNINKTGQALPAGVYIWAVVAP
jgi:hypothetical protein